MCIKICTGASNGEHYDFHTTSQWTNRSESHKNINSISNAFVNTASDSHFSPAATTFALKNGNRPWNSPCLFPTKSPSSFRLSSLDNSISSTTVSAICHTLRSPQKTPKIKRSWIFLENIKKSLRRGKKRMKFVSSLRHWSTAFRAAAAAAAIIVAIAIAATTTQYFICFANLDIIESFDRLISDKTHISEWYRSVICVFTE